MIKKLKENKIFNKIKNYSVVFIILIWSFVLLLTITSCIPSDYLEEHIKETADILIKEGNHKNVWVSYKKEEMIFDNFSDALMLNTAYSIDSETPLYSALMARKNFLPGVTKTISVDEPGELKSDSMFNGEHDEVGELYSLAHGNINDSFEYARYWHGYLVFLRIALIFANVTTIRIVLTVLLCILLGIFTYLVIKKINWFIGVIFLTGLISVETLYMGVSLQGYSVFFIMLTFSIFVLLRYKKIKDVGMCFFIVGSISNFFDILTVPILTLGIPLIIYFLLEQSNRKLDAKEEIIILLKTIISWFLGYALTWASKWVLVQIIYDRDLIKVALKQIMFRTNGVDKITLLEPTIIVWKYVKKYVVFSFILVFIYDIFNYKHKNLNRNIKEKVSLLFPYIVIALLPILWYSVLRDHSFKHNFFSYRALALTIIDLAIILILYLNEQSILNKGDNKVKIKIKKILNKIKEIKNTKKE